MDEKKQNLKDLEQLKTWLTDGTSIVCARIKCKDCKFNNYGDRRKELSEKYFYNSCGMSMLIDVAKEIFDNYKDGYPE